MRGVHGRVFAPLCVCTPHNCAHHWACLPPRRAHHSLSWTATRHIQTLPRCPAAPLPSFAVRQLVRIAESGYRPPWPWPQPPSVVARAHVAPAMATSSSASSAAATATAATSPGGRPATAATAGAVEAGAVAALAAASAAAASAAAAANSAALARQPALALLRPLYERCTQPAPEDRPTFEQVRAGAGTRS